MIEEVKNIYPDAVLGKYRVDREIGRGGMGIVYLALDTNLNRNIALKVLHPSLCADKSFVERFRTEAQVIAALEHPNIVHVNNLEVVGERFLIDMEYVGGPSLHDALYGRMYTPSKLAGLAQEVLLGLAACHSIGIVHRDLKPSNVLLTQDGRVKLCDFGLATAYASNYERSAGPPTTTGFYLGTPRYAPPELWDGATPTCSWDLYSLGVMLYEGITGEAPYSGESPLAILKAQIEKGIPPILERAPHISPEFGAFIDQILAEGPAARPESAVEALELLESTPEFVASRHKKHDPTIAIPKQIRVKREKSELNAEVRPRSRPAYWMLAVALFGMLAGAVVIGMQYFKSASPMSIGDLQEHLSLEEVSANRIADEEEVLRLPRTKSEVNWPTVHIDVLGIEGMNSMTGLLIPEDGKSKHSLIAYSDRAIWSIVVEGADSRNATLTGDYACYLDEAATIFRQGTMQGAGLWSSVGEQVTGSLELADSRSNAEIQATISTSPLGDEWTSTRFFASMESAPLPMLILYNELMPRGAAWALKLSQLLPALPRSQIFARQLPQSSQSVRVDGTLESIWTDGATAESARGWSLDGVPYSLKPRLFTLYSGEELYLAVQVPGGLKSNASIAVSFLPALEVPVPESPVYMLTATSTGQFDASCHAGKQTYPWNVSAEVQSSVANGIWTAEMRLPFSDLPGLPIQMIGEQLRINCQVLDGTPGDTHTKCVARWGWPDVKKAQHGVLLHFDGNAAS